PTAPQGHARHAGRPAGRCPGLPDRDRLRPPERHPLVDAPPGDGLRVRRHLLAPPPVLAATRGLEEVAPRGPRPPRPAGPDRLVRRRRGQPELPRRFGGVLTGKNPTDRAKKGSKRHLLTDRRGTPLAVRI